MSATVNRSDITLTEDVQVEYRMWGIEEQTSTNWTATLDGHLSSGERVEMSRFGPTAEDALTDLEETIRAQGWEVI